MEGILRFKIDWASLIVGRKFALFYFAFEGNFQVQAPGDLYLEGRFNGGFFCITGLGGLYLEGLIHGGAYFRNFTVLKFILGSKAWGNKTKEIILRLSNEQFISFVLFPKPWSQKSSYYVLAKPSPSPHPATFCYTLVPNTGSLLLSRRERSTALSSIEDLSTTMPPKKSKGKKVWCFLILNVFLISQTRVFTCP